MQITTLMCEDHDESVVKDLMKLKQNKIANHHHHYHNIFVVPYILRILDGHLIGLIFMGVSTFI